MAGEKARRGGPGLGTADLKVRQFLFQALFSFVIFLIQILNAFQMRSLLLALFYFESLFNDVMIVRGKKIRCLRFHPGKPMRRLRTTAIRSASGESPLAVALIGAYDIGRQRRPVRYQTAHSFCKVALHAFIFIFWKARR